MSTTKDYKLYLLFLSLRATVFNKTGRTQSVAYARFHNGW